MSPMEQVADCGISDCGRNRRRGPGPGGGAGLVARRCNLRLPFVRVAGVLLFALTVSAPSARAHERGTSYSSWEIRGRQARVVLRLTELDVSRFPWAATAGAQLRARLGSYLAGHLLLFAGESPCTVSDGPLPLAAAPGTLLYEWQLTCPGQGPLRIRTTLLREVSPSHLHFARARLDGAPVAERVLSERGDIWELTGGDADEPDRGADLAGYVILGIEHILGGFDHLAFVLALLLLGGSMTEVAKVITGFTVGHSFTLAAMVLGYLRPDPAPIEALIGMSIALVAIENLWQLAGRRSRVPLTLTLVVGLLAVAAAFGYGRVPAMTLTGLALFVACYFRLLAMVADTASLRWAIAFLFGLVHGFGFAAVLDEAGLPPDRVVAALFGFNAGVEIGQLAVVAVVWPVLRVLAVRWRALWAWAVEAGSAAVLAVGFFWFVTRTYG